MLPVPCPLILCPPCPSPVLLAHPPGFHLGKWLGVPSPFSLPHFPSRLLLVSASPVVACPTTHVLGGPLPWGAWGQNLGQGSSHGAPLMGSPSHCPGRPCQIRQQCRSRQQRGWALPAAGTSRGAVSSSGGSGSPPPPSPAARRGDRTLSFSWGRAPTPPEPGPVSRRGGGGNRASRDRPGAGTSGTAGALPPRRRPQVRAGLGHRGLGERGRSAPGLAGFGVSGMVARM